MKPIIGITLDYPLDDSYAKTPWYAIRENYITAISASGGIPFLLHYEFNDFDYLARTLDGLVLTGGSFDIDPSVYGEEIKNSNVTTNTKRSAFEMQVLNSALENKKPILGICAGEQLINVMHGGSLVQHIPDEIENALEHSYNMDRHIPRHTVKVKEASLLYRIVGETEYQVNSTHHQSVKNLGEGFIASAHSEDGVIEAIEKSDMDSFCLGVQWHPEYFHIPQDQKLIKYFVNECHKYRKKNLQE